MACFFLLYLFTFWCRYAREWKMDFSQFITIKLFSYAICEKTRQFLFLQGFSVKFQIIVYHNDTRDGLGGSWVASIHRKRRHSLIFISQTLENMSISTEPHFGCWMQFCLMKLNSHLNNIWFSYKGKFFKPFICNGLNYEVIITIHLLSLQILKSSQHGIWHLSKHFTFMLISY